MSANRRMMVSIMAAQKPPAMTDKIWDFLEPDYAYTHMNIGAAVVAGDGIQHWLSREGKKALGAEIYFQPNFYNFLGAGWSYNPTTDVYSRASGDAGSAVGRTHTPYLLAQNAIYKVDAEIIATNDFEFSALNYIGGYRSTAFSGAKSFLLQPITVAGQTVRFHGYAASVIDYKVTSIKPVNSILAYQSTSTSRPIARVDSRGVMYSEWDLTDDSLTAYFDAAITGGEIMIATSAGIHFASLTTTTNEFTFGPTSYTGGAANILNTLKDPVTNKLHLYGLRIKETGAYTAEEKAYLVYLYGAVTGNRTVII